MFEETGVQAFHVDRTFGRVRLVFVQLTSNGTVLTVDTATSTPGITVSGTTGDYALAGIPTGTLFQWVGGMVQLAEATGVGGDVRPEASSASAGTCSFETSTATAPGTAAAPAAGSRVFITIMIGRTG